MRPLSAVLITATSAIMCAALVVASDTKAHGDLFVARSVQSRDLPRSPSDFSTAALPGLDARLGQAVDDAVKSGATISVILHDRVTEQTVSKGDNIPLAIASVTKLLIADDMLMGDVRGDRPLSPDDRQALDGMLRSSDDDAAERFWDRGGGDAIINRVAARYGLASTAPPPDGRWWNTVSTAADLVRYYDGLLDGNGGLPPERASLIINDLAQSTPQGSDGYPQRFGIPEGLYAERVAVKQGWMCCIGNSWMHLSTGVIGPDRRYIMVIASQQPSDDATARVTITQVVKTMFPSGVIA